MFAAPAIRRLENNITPALPELSQASTAVVWQWYRPRAIEDDRSTPPESDWKPTPSQADGFGSAVRQIFALLSSDGVDEFGTLRPTRYAQIQTLRLLSRAYSVFAGDAVNRRLQRHFPKGFVATDSEGGIRIEWLTDSNSVRLIVPASEKGQSYIYFENAKQYGTTKRVTGGTLAQFLRNVT